MILIMDLLCMGKDETDEYKEDILLYIAVSYERYLGNDIRRR